MRRDGDEKDCVRPRRFWGAEFGKLSAKGVLIVLDLNALGKIVVRYLGFLGVLG